MDQQLWNDFLHHILRSVPQVRPRRRSKSHTSQVGSTISDLYPLDHSNRIGHQVHDCCQVDVHAGRAGVRMYTIRAHIVRGKVDALQIMSYSRFKKLCPIGTIYFSIHTVDLFLSVGEGCSESTGLGILVSWTPSLFGLGRPRLIPKAGLL